MWKLVKRIIIIFLLFFAFLNIVIFFVLNSPIVQHSVVHYINENYLNKQNLELRFDSMDVSFLSGSINLNDVYIHEKRDPSLPKSPNGDKNSGFKLSINQLSVSVNIAASYLKWRPVVRKILIRGVNFNIPALNFASKEPGKGKIDIPLFLKNNMAKIPADIEILNSTFTMGSKEEKNYQIFSISQLKLQKTKHFLSPPKLELIALITDSNFILPSKQASLAVSSGKIQLILSQNGDFSVPKCEIKSNVVNLSAHVQGRIASDIQKSNYTAKVEQLDINSKNAFEFLAMKSTGTVNISGEITSGKNVSDLPTFAGKLRWKELSLLQFDIYSGDADLYFANQKISYENAKIQTPRNGILTANGEFQFYKNFYFENKVKVQNFSLAELLKGLGANHSPVDVNLNSDNLIVSGYLMSSNARKKFELFARGDLDGNNLQVTALESQKGRSSLPELKLALDLDVNALGLSFAPKEIFLYKNKKTMGSINLEHGVLGFENPKGIDGDFKLSSYHLDLTGLEYFLMLPIKGTANLNAEIKIKSGNVTVASSVEIPKATIADVNFKDFKGNIGVNTQQVWLENTSVIINGENNINSASDAAIHISNFTLSYHDLKAKIIATAKGSLHGIIMAIQNWLPEKLHQITGNINSLAINFNGALKHPTTWDLNAVGQVQELTLLNGYFKTLHISLDCLAGICQNSSIILNGISSVDNAEEDVEASATTKRNSSETSFAIFNINKVSFADAAFRAHIHRVPLSIFNDFLPSKIQGTISAHVQMSGVWKKPQGFMDSSVYNLRYNNLDIGPLNIHLAPIPDNKLKFDLFGFQNQLHLSYTTSEDLMGTSALTLNLSKFDPTLLISAKVREAHSLFAGINGSFNLSGPSPLAKMSGGKTWLSLWQGKGQLDSLDFQVENLFFALPEVLHTEFSQNVFTIDSFHIDETKNLLHFSVDKTSFDFTKQLLNLNIALDADLKELTRFANVFGPSTGKIIGRFSVMGKVTDPKIWGKLTLRADKLSLKNYTPDFENLNADIVLDDHKITIDSFHGNKGNGTLDITGEAVFSSFANLPTFSIDVRAKDLDLRFPVPIFQVTDTTLDAFLSLKGSETDLPYSLSGTVILKKFKLFRDINCTDIGNEIATQYMGEQTLTDGQPFANLYINLQTQNPVVIQSQCLRGHFSTAPSIVLRGTTSAPLLSGNITTNTANLFLLKSRFNVKQADFNFFEFQKYDPNVNIRMESRVSSYTIFMNISGRLSVAPINLSIEPETLPNGDKITQADIISIISTGTIPEQSTNANLLSATATAFSLFGGNNLFETTLNSTVSSLTGGIIDSVSIAPTTQNGQLSWRATASRSFFKRLNLGVTYEEGSIGTDQSAYATIIINNTISIISSYENSYLIQQQATQELFSGLRFRFGSQ